MLTSTVYGCGLLLWHILLDGKYPWQLERFDDEAAYQEYKVDGIGLLDFAIGTCIEDANVPEDRVEEISLLFASLLTESSARTLDSLTQYGTFKDRKQVYLSSSNEGTLIFISATLVPVIETEDVGNENNLVDRPV